MLFDCCVAVVCGLLELGLVAVLVWFVLLDLDVWFVWWNICVVRELGVRSGGCLCCFFVAGGGVCWLC